MVMTLVSPRRLVSVVMYCESSTFLICLFRHSNPNDVEKNAILKTHRVLQVQQRKKKYNWQKFPKLGMPSAIDCKAKNLPSDEQFGTVKTINFTAEALSSAASVEFKVMFTKIESLYQFEQLATCIAKPEFPTYEMARWTRDEEFGRQMLNGVNPVIIERCTQLPSNFPVTSDMVKGSLVRGLSLEDEMKVSLNFPSTR